MDMKGKGTDKDKGKGDAVDACGKRQLMRDIIERLPAFFRGKHTDGRRCFDDVRKFAKGLKLWSEEPEFLSYCLWESLWREGSSPDELKGRVALQALAYFVCLLQQQGRVQSSEGSFMSLCSQKTLDLELIRNFRYACNGGRYEKFACRLCTQFMGHLFANALDRYLFADGLPGRGVQDLGLFFRSVLPARDAAGALRGRWRIQLCLDLVGVCGPVLERSEEGARELDSWLRGIAEVRARVGQASRTQDRMQRVLDGWPRARVVRHFVQGQGLSGAYDMLDLATWAETCRISSWWRQVVVQRFASDFKRKYHEWRQEQEREEREERLYWDHGDWRETEDERRERQRTERQYFDW